MQQFIGLALLAVVHISVASIQQPLSGLEADEYQFDWLIQKVAVIGAGPSGLLAYRELTEVGLAVRVFERDNVPGGNWHYTEEVPLDAPVPNALIPIGDFVPSLPPPGIDLPYSEEFEDDGKIRRDHRAPKPVWKSLTSNIPSRLQQFPQWPFPPGTQWELTHYQLRNYFRSYASYLNINSNDENPAMAYNTRVEYVEKRINEAGQEQGWRLWLRSLEPTEFGTYRATWWTEDFDAVVVAVGKYNVPFMPSIPGLDEWVRRFPDLIRHSRQYRKSDAYTNQTVLVIGASVRKILELPSSDVDNRQISGTEIPRDLNHQARKVYLSFRPDSKIQTLKDNVRLPKNTTLVGEIKRFLPVPEGSPIQSGLIELKNGTILSGFDAMILATGYRYSYPFLPQYYDGATYVPRAGSAATLSPFLPLDGLRIRDLYLDQFYYRDPTLAFIGLMPLLDYPVIALAKVWTGTAKLPNSPTMRVWCKKNMEKYSGRGRYPKFLPGQGSAARMAFLVGWLNEAAVKYGGNQVDTPPKGNADIWHYWQIEHFGRLVQFKGPKEDEMIPTSSHTDGSWYDVFFDDDDW